jgi:hypothetical protein
MPIRESRNLCQMGDNDDLAVLREPCQSASDLDSNLAADTCINLVEDKRGGLGIGREHDLQGQANSG